MRYLSVCSGIEAATCAWHGAATCAWHGLGWEPFAFSEIEPFPSAVLAHHYPTVPNLGDMTQFKGWPDAAIDVLVGGTPCQSFSVAGLRKGLADPRGNLMLTYGAIAAKYRPEWLVWENVPGVLSSNCGRDFGTFLGMLAELGYGFAYRILDAQYFGVAQRRRRVFVVGHLGDWRRAAAVLFERHSLQGHPAPRRETGKVAPTIPSRSLGGGGLGTDFDCDGGLIAEPTCMSTGQAGAEIGIGIGIGTTLNCNHEAPIVAHSLRGDSHNLEYRQDGTANALLTPNGGRGGIGVGAIAFDTTITSTANYSNPQPGDPCHPLASGAHAPAVAFQGADHASTQERNATQALHALRREVGEEAFAMWRSGVLDSFQPQEVLQQDVHGGSVRREAQQAGCGMDDRALSRAPSDSGWAMREVRQAGCKRRTPSGRGLQEQLARELDAALSKLPHEGAPPGWLLRGVWREGEGSRIVQPALPPTQGGATLQVRRLTPVECEKLQGFPPGYTDIPYRNKPAADGPRYKALGNSMAVPVMRWIGERIEMVMQPTGGADGART